MNSLEVVRLWLYGQVVHETGRWAWLSDPRSTVLILLGGIALVGGAWRLWRAWKTRIAVERAGNPKVTPEEIAELGEHGRAGLMDLFRLLDEAPDPRQRHAAGEALGVLWARDELIPEEEKAIVRRGFEVHWRARRRYPRALLAPIPFAVEFGVPFLGGERPGVRSGQLEWSYRIEGAERAALESWSEWRGGRAHVAFAVEPGDLRGNGPHRLVLKTRVRTSNLTSSWELDLPHVAFSFEFDPVLEPEAILTLPDSSLGEDLARSVRLGTVVEEEATGASNPAFVSLGGGFSLREPPRLLIPTPVPNDLAHDVHVEFEGVPGSLRGGTVVVAGQETGLEAGTIRVVPIGPFDPAGSVLEHPGEYRMRVLLTPNPHLGWAEPDVRSVWPGTIATEWITVRVVRS